MKVAKSKKKFEIFTSGPIVKTDQESLSGAIKYAMQYMPLKRGWTFDAEVLKPGVAAVVHRRNSKGVIVKGYSVRIARVS